MDEKLPDGMVLAALVLRGLGSPFRVILLAMEELSATEGGVPRILVQKRGKQYANYDFGKFEDNAVERVQFSRT